MGFRRRVLALALVAMTVCAVGKADVWAKGAKKADAGVKAAAVTAGEADVTWIKKPNANYPNGIFQIGNWIYWANSAEAGLDEGLALYSWSAGSGDDLKVLEAPEYIQGKRIRGFVTDYTWMYSSKVKDTLQSEGLPDSVEKVVVPSWIYGINRSRYSNEFLYADLFLIDGELECVYAVPMTAKGLKEIAVDPANQAFMSEDGVLYSKDGKYLIQYPAAKEDSEFIVPDHVKYICQRAFSDCKFLKTVSIPASVEEIDRCAFYNCASLSKVYVTDATDVYLDMDVDDIDYPIPEAKWGNKVKVYCPAGSVMDWFAREQGYKVSNYAVPGTVKGLKGSRKIPKDFNPEKIISYATLTYKWKDVAGADGYEVAYKTTGLNNRYQTTTVENYGSERLTSTSFQTASVRGMWVKLRAYKKVGGLTVYGEFCKPVLVAVTPRQVKNVSAKTSGTGKVKLSWKSLNNWTEGCEGYEIYRSKSAGKKFEKIATVKKSYTTTYTDKKSKKGTTYYYYVRAYSSSGKDVLYGKNSKTVKVKAK